MIPFIKGFTGMQSLNQAALKDNEPTNLKKFYVKMADGVWGE